METKEEGNVENEDYFRRSIMIVNSYAFYILLLALLGAVLHVRWIGGGKFSHENVFPSLTILYAIISFFFYLFIYAHLVDSITKNSAESWKMIINLYGKNYLTLSLFRLSININLFLFVNFLSSYFNLTYYMKGYAFIVCNSIIECLAIYIYPLIFFRKGLLFSIVKGIKTLFSMFDKSIILILLVFIQPVIALLIGIDRPITISAMIGIGFIHKYIFISLDLFIFSAATIILLNQEKEVKVLSQN
jgi:hypothetical protein